MARAEPTSGTGTDTANEHWQWRLRYLVSDIVHYTDWTHDFAVVENYYTQYRRGDYSHDVVIERRTEVRG